MDRGKTKDWRQLSEAASRELDPKKLMALIDELKKVLDDRDGRSGGRTLPERTESQMIASCPRSESPLLPYFG